jgi:D-glycero-alpha-D-manno-heptose-7-phosphate kinase
MIISKSPLRIPFAGGLSDIRAFAENYGGATVSATIDKYVYVGVKTNVDGYINLKYYDAHEKVRDIEEVKHDHIRESLKLLKLDQIPVDLYIMTDMNYESGLGSSGAVTVAILNALHRFKGEEVTKNQLIEEASYIEIDALEGAAGYHDHSISALGGIQFIEYDGRTVSPRKIDIPEVQRDLFGSRLMFFYTGRHAKTKPSLEILNSNMEAAHDALTEIKHLAYDLQASFLRGDLQNAGRIIQRQQEIKQTLPGNFDDQFVHDIVEKINGLGGQVQIPGGKIGAFVMVYAEEQKQQRIRRELADFYEVKFNLEEQGAQVVEI